jgi:hypothetical protein
VGSGSGSKAHAGGPAQALDPRAEAHLYDDDLEEPAPTPLQVDTTATATATQVPGSSHAPLQGKEPAASASASTAAHPPGSVRAPHPPPPRGSGGAVTLGVGALAQTVVVVQQAQSSSSSVIQSSSSQSSSSSSQQSLSSVGTKRTAAGYSSSPALNPPTPDQEPNELKAADSRALVGSEGEKEGEKERARELGRGSAEARRASLSSLLPDPTKPLQEKLAVEAAEKLHQRRASTSSLGFPAPPAQASSSGPSPDRATADAPSHAAGVAGPLPADKSASTPPTSVNSPVSSNSTNPAPGLAGPERARGSEGIANGAGAAASSEPGHVSAPAQKDREKGAKEGKEGKQPEKPQSPRRSPRKKVQETDIHEYMYTLTYVYRSRVWRRKRRTKSKRTTKRISTKTRHRVTPYPTLHSVVNSNLYANKLDINCAHNTA